MSSTIKPDRLHFGKFGGFDTEQLGYKTIVISTMIQGQKDLMWGRLIQVRKKSGAFGTDTILIRKADGNLASFHNMSFFAVNKTFLPMYEEAMKEVDAENYDNLTIKYSIEGKNPAAGFVVHGLDDKFGKNYSFSMTEEKDGNTTKIKFTGITETQG